MTAWYLAGSRVKAIVGHYGSGKTEIALNMALKIRQVYPETALADMDVVNPFFRSAEQRQLLLDHGVEPIHSPMVLTAADIPALPPELLSIFARSVREPSGNSPFFIRSNRSRFSSTERSRHGLFFPGSVRVPRYSRSSSALRSQT